MTDAQRVVRIEPVEAGYTKGKCYSRPLYLRRVRLHLANGEVVDWQESALKLTDLKRRTVDAPPRNPMWIQRTADGNLYRTEAPFG